MKNKVTVVSKAGFHELIDGKGMDSETSYISIEGTPECIEHWIKDDDNDHLLPSGPHVLNLNFDDVTEDEYEYEGHIFRTISFDEAREILDFVERQKGRDLVIHCKAGRSRSQAVARFIVDCFPDDWVGNRLLETYNPEVLGRLKRVYYDRLYHGNT